MRSMNLKKMFITCCQISLVQKFQTRIIFVLVLVCVCVFMGEVCKVSAVSPGTSLLLILVAVSEGAAVIFAPFAGVNVKCSTWLCWKHFCFTEGQRRLGKVQGTLFWGVLMHKITQLAYGNLVGDSFYFSAGILI